MGAANGEVERPFVAQDGLADSSWGCNVLPGILLSGTDKMEWGAGLLQKALITDEQYPGGLVGGLPTDPVNSQGVS